MSAAQTPVFVEVSVTGTAHAGKVCVQFFAPPLVCAMVNIEDARLAIAHLAPVPNGAQLFLPLALPVRCLQVLLIGQGA